MVLLPLSLGCGLTSLFVFILRARCPVRAPQNLYIPIDNDTSRARRTQLALPDALLARNLCIDLLVLCR